MWEKRYLGVFTHPKAIICKYECPLPKEKFACRESDFWTLRSNVFAKTNKFAKPILPVHMGPMSNLLSNKNNGRKSVPDTVPLRQCIKCSICVLDSLPFYRRLCTVLSIRMAYLFYLYHFLSSISDILYICVFSHNVLYLCISAVCCTYTVSTESRAVYLSIKAVVYV